MISLGNKLKVMTMICLVLHRDFQELDRFFIAPNKHFVGNFHIEF